MKERPRRLRASFAVRELVAETHLSYRNLVQPYFVSPLKIDSEPIPGFGDVRRYGKEALLHQVEKDLENGVRHFLLFGAAAEKDAVGSESANEDAAVPQALQRLKAAFGSQASFYADICLCPYTSHGHCGVWEQGQVVNDASVELLVKSAVVHAQAGADFVAPSDMMDGRVGAIRQGLDTAGYTDTGILSYTAKFASQYYGPFRHALDSAPEAGSDRRGYQMDSRNVRESLRELRLDIEEGADMVMVKPALAYLDILAQVRANCDVPVLAYSVSGEYQMVRLMAEAGLATERDLAVENLQAIRRAGASAIITYFASRAAEQRWL
ncbi:porphobilinogen synthase [bacterium]|nr:porphobilinogen synthase [bacterium]